MTQLLMTVILALLVSIATYNDSLQGAQTAAPEAEGIALNLTASGDLPGMSKVKLQRDGQNVTGGSFRMTVLPQNPDASSEDAKFWRKLLGGKTDQGVASFRIGLSLVICSVFSQRM